jgi:hypothetical protein
MLSLGRQGVMEKKLEKRSLCKWEKSDIRKNIKALYALTADPQYVCEKCARVANSRTTVCKPYKFEIPPRHIN